MNFGQAIEALKEGKRVARKGWNGRNMHIYLEEHLSVSLGRNGTHQYEPMIVMFTAQEKHQPGWLASQADMLADDWQEVPADV